MEELCKQRPLLVKHKKMQKPLLTVIKALEKVTAMSLSRLLVYGNCGQVKGEGMGKTAVLGRKKTAFFWRCLYVLN